MHIKQIVSFMSLIHAYSSNHHVLCFDNDFRKSVQSAYKCVNVVWFEFGGIC